MYLLRNKGLNPETCYLRQIPFSCDAMSSTCTPKNRVGHISKMAKLGWTIISHWIKSILSCETDFQPIDCLISWNSTFGSSQKRNMGTKWFELLARCSFAENDVILLQEPINAFKRGLPLYTAFISGKWVCRLLLSINSRHKKKLFDVAIAKLTIRIDGVLNFYTQLIFLGPPDTKTSWRWWRMLLLSPSQWYSNIAPKFFIGRPYRVLEFTRYSIFLRILVVAKYFIFNIKMFSYVTHKYINCHAISLKFSQFY